MSNHQKANAQLSEMTLRDYFAAKAMQSLIAKEYPFTGSINDNALNVDILAKRAYLLLTL